MNKKKTVAVGVDGEMKGHTKACPQCDRRHTVLWRGLDITINCPCGMVIILKPWAKIREVFPWIEADE